MVEFHFTATILDLLPPKPKFHFRRLKKWIQEFHRRFVLAPVDKAANNVVVVWKRYYINTLFLSLFLYILPGARFRALLAGVHCTLRVAGWKPPSDHIEITLGFFNLHRGWLSLHRGHPVNIPIRRTMHLSSVIPANDTRESVFGHRNLPRSERGSNLGPLAPEASALTTELPRFQNSKFHPKARTKHCKNIWA